MRSSLETTLPFEKQAVLEEPPHALSCLVRRLEGSGRRLPINTLPAFRIADGIDE
jgi:hypothetical protein